jgi:hypothetical protein
MTKRTVHIVFGYEGDAGFARHWEECLPPLLAGRGFEVNRIWGGTVPFGTGLLGDTIWKTTQLETLNRMFLQKTVSPGDVFVFTNAWNFSIIPLNYLRLQQGIDLTFIGFWREGLYDSDSEVSNGLFGQPKGWAHHYELGMFDSYDYNCFFNDQQLERFHRRYRRQMSDRAYTTGFPFERLGPADLDLSQKEDLVVFPYPPDENSQYDLIKGLAGDLPGCEFVFCCEHRMKRSEYLDLLRRAKAIFSGTLSETDPSLIWEGMLYGCTPIVPDRLVYREVLAEHYRYPSEYTRANKRLYVIRNRGYLKDILVDAMTNYEQRRQRLIKDTVVVTNKFYLDHRFEHLITNVQEQ